MLKRLLSLLLVLAVLLPAGAWAEKIIFEDEGEAAAAPETTPFTLLQYGDSGEHVLAALHGVRGDLLHLRDHGLLAAKGDEAAGDLGTADVHGDDGLAHFSP